MTQNCHKVLKKKLPLHFNKYVNEINMPKILIVDDEPVIRTTLREIFEYEKYEIDEAGDAKKALKMIEKWEYKAILSDIKMPDMNGMEFLEELQKRDSTIPVIMITGHGDIETAVEALKKGAFDFIQKPLDLNRLLISVRHALEKEQLVGETKKLKKKVNKRYEIIGKSPSIENVKSMIERVAPTNTRVLITG
jgi:DNA-binding NtrC family response regulator